MAFVEPTARVEKLWPGSTIVIIGGGSSLTQEDVTYVSVRAAARKLERRLLKSPEPDIRIIAIKEAVELAPDADVLYACDDKWWRYYPKWRTFTGLKFALEPQTEAWPDVQILRNTGHEGLELDPSGLRTGHNSGCQAVNLAVHLGATKIVLLGFDMWAGPDGRRNWFDKPGLHENSPYPIFLMRFAQMVEPLKSAGVRVVNASRFTVMESFQRVSLVEALA